MRTAPVSQDTKLTALAMQELKANICEFSHASCLKTCSAVVCLVGIILCAAAYAHAACQVHMWSTFLLHTVQSAQLQAQQEDATGLSRCSTLQRY